MFVIYLQCFLTATGFRMIYIYGEVENSRSSSRAQSSAACSSSGLDFAPFSLSLLREARERKHLLCKHNGRGLLYKNDASSSNYIAVPCILGPVLVHSRDHAYPNAISGSTANRPAEHSMAELVNKSTETLEMWLNSGISLRGPCGTVGPVHNYCRVSARHQSLHTALFFYMRRNIVAYVSFNIFIHTCHNPKYSL
jgi:hypothetical protein